MTLEYFLSWMLLMGPLVLSPGPANLVFAASGAKYGVTKSLPLLFGIDLVFVVYSIVFGFGFGVLLTGNAQLYKVVQVIGVLYLVYLTYKLVRSPMVSSEGEVDSKKYTFIDGVILQLTNPKGWTMLITMFAVFLDGSFNETTQVWTLVIMLCILNVSVHVLWIFLGNSLTVLLMKPAYEVFIRWTFGVSMFLVAAWILFKG